MLGETEGMWVLIMAGQLLCQRPLLLDFSGGVSVARILAARLLHKQLLLDWGPGPSNVSMHGWVNSLP